MTADPPTDGSVNNAALRDLDAETLYALLRLRVDVFVVEQDCPYAELDGRDTEAGTRHLWLADAAGPTSYLRLLRADDWRIGRVCTRRDARGGGLAARLLSAALDTVGDDRVVLDAQTHLADWYGRFGFEVSGPPFVEDGIPHVPMRRKGNTVRA